MHRMKTMWALSILSGFAVAASAGGTKGGVKTLTGCLQKGTTADTWVLTNVSHPEKASSGEKAVMKEWDLVGAPASLALTDHVGHKVEITGTVTGMPAKVQEKTTTTASDDTTVTKKEVKMEGHRHQLTVQSMKHIAGTCP
jgi:hypothetical protein